MEKVNAKNRMTNSRKKSKEETFQIHWNIGGFVITDPNMMYTDAYMKGKIDKAIDKDPTFIYSICCVTF